MALIPFPDVPNVPGVPQIPRSITVPTLGGVLNSALGAITDALFGRPIWGIFDTEGKKVIEPDSFLSIDVQKADRVSNYPQEKGAFGSYNKVATPYDCRVRMSIGADKAARTAFLETCDKLLGGLELLTVVTPEATYPSATLQGYNYRRESTNGVSMLIVEFDFIEVRVTATADTAQINGPQSPAATPEVSGGQVQTFPVNQPSVVGVPL